MKQQKDIGRKRKQMGKGDKRRPTKVDEETFANNWERIFGKKSNEKENTEKATKDDTSKNVS